MKRNSVYFISLAIIVCSVFTMFFQVQNATLIENQTNAYLNEINSYNESILYNGMNNVNNGTTNEQIYFNATDAVCDVFKKVNALKEYEIVANSVANANALNNTIILDMNTKIINYASGNYLLSTLRYQRPHEIDKIVNLGFTAGNLQYFVRPERFQIDSKSITKSATGINVEWESDRFYNMHKPFTATSYFYRIDKKAIKSELGFEVYVNPITKKITRYYVSVELNAAYATADYRRMLAEQIDNNTVNFTKEILHCVLDGDGNLLSFRTDETYNFVVNIAVVGDIYVTIDQQNNYMINEKVSVEEPVMQDDGYYHVKF